MGLRVLSATRQRTARTPPLVVPRWGRRRALAEASRPEGAAVGGRRCDELLSRWVASQSRILRTTKRSALSMTKYVVMSSGTREAKSGSEDASARRKCGGGDAQWNGRLSGAHQPGKGRTQLSRENGWRAPSSISSTTSLDAPLSGLELLSFDAAVTKRSLSEAHSRPSTYTTELPLCSRTALIMDVFPVSGGPVTRMSSFPHEPSAFLNAFICSARSEY